MSLYILNPRIHGPPLSLAFVPKIRSNRRPWITRKPKKITNNQKNETPLGLVVVDRPRSGDGRENDAPVTQLLSQTEITRRREMTLQKYGTVGFSLFLAFPRGKKEKWAQKCSRHLLKFPHFNYLVCLPASLTPRVVVTAPAGSPDTVLWRAGQDATRNQQRSDDASAFSEAEVKKGSAW